MKSFVKKLSLLVLMLGSFGIIGCWSEQAKVEHKENSARINIVHTTLGLFSIFDPQGFTNVFGSSKVLLQDEIVETLVPYAKEAMGVEQDEWRNLICIDTRGHPLRIQVEWLDIEDESKWLPVTVKIWSVGRNEIDEQGLGDDVLIAQNVKIPRGTQRFSLPDP